jgi:hypothetical protein
MGFGAELQTRPASPIWRQLPDVFSNRSMGGGLVEIAVG